MSDVDDLDFTPDGVKKLASDNLDMLDGWYLANHGIVTERAEMKASIATLEARLAGACLRAEKAERERDEAVGRWEEAKRLGHEAFRLAMTNQDRAEAAEARLAEVERAADPEAVYEAALKGFDAPMPRGAAYDRLHMALDALRLAGYRIVSTARFMEKRDA